MPRRRSAYSVAVALLMLISVITFILSERAAASYWLETSEVDFGDGNLLTGGGFETEIHGIGSAAYLQNKKDVGNWVERFPPSNPGPRKSFGFTNNSLASTFILFGGMDGSSSARNDTWEYDAGSNTWTRICADDTRACAPPRRYYHSMAYDNNSKVAVMYGGYAADLTTVLEDTWEFHVTNNTWVNRTAMTKPQRLAYHSMVYDPITKQMILVGRGMTGMEVWAYSALTHTWQQKPCSGLTPRSGFALAFNYQPGYMKVVLFGGSEMMQAFDDTWEYNTQTNFWSQTLAGGPPPARSGAKTTYISSKSTQGVLLWGGSIDSNDSWTYKWQWIPPSPPFANWVHLLTPAYPTPLRKDYGLAYDPGHDSVVLYGGSDFAGAQLDDTWTIEWGFRLEGKYISSIFNTYSTVTSWEHIFWNQTPANVPPNTLIRMQLNVSNECNDSGLPVWGPFITSPGQSIDISGFKCIRYMADMITYDTSVAPKLEDVTLVYAVTPLPPSVVSYSPKMYNVPTTAPFYVNFSKPMNTANVWFSVVPNVTLVRPWTWYEGDTKVKISHSTSFPQGQQYDVCVWGTDKSGVILNHNGGRFCWSFVTIPPTPYIVSTLPKPGATNVKVTHLILVLFNVKMNTSSCWPYITISPHIELEWTWDASATELTGYHNSTDFEELTTYTVEVPVGDPARPCRSKADLLIQYGPWTNRWDFTTEAIRPYVVSTDPANLHPFTELDKVINVTFSRDMQRDSLTYSLVDIGLGINWTGMLTPNWSSNISVSFTHSQLFRQCAPYEMQVWALDLGGLPLINKNVFAPNPWRFMTIGSGGCPPFMMLTRPGDGDKDVPIGENITIAWWTSAGMDVSSFRVAVKDQYGGDFAPLMHPEWNGPGPEMLVLSHFIPPYNIFRPFNTCMNYTVTVLTAKDKLGRDFIPGLAVHPFTFSTVVKDCQPLLIWSQPAPYETDVPLDRDFILKFSYPMDTSNVMFRTIPDEGPYQYSWRENDTNVTISHPKLTACQQYKALVVAFDKNGKSLAIGPHPNPWDFTAICEQGPTIESVIPPPFHNDTSLTWRIFVNFSEPMDTSSVDLILMPSAGTLTYQWVDFDQTLVVHHSLPFEDCRFITARVRNATNKTGAPLVAGHVPNPWKFRTICVPPYIVSTSPADKEVVVSIGAPITIVFSEPVYYNTFEFDLVPSVGLSQVWQNDRTVTLIHSKTFLVCRKYFAWVRNVQDMTTNDLTKGPVPNPWNFTTDCRFPVRGLQVHRMPPNDVFLEWKASPEATHYKVFHSTVRTAPWPWTEIADVAADSALLRGHLSDMQNHFYIVRGYNATQESSNSTMGALWHLSVAPNVGRVSALWFGLPYNSIYKKASDIVKELTESNINLVAKWDPVLQKNVLYYFLDGQWRGQDFQIKAGDGLLLGVVRAFGWAVNGTDGTIPISFGFRQQFRWNFYWIGLPFTGKAGSASQLVISIEGGLGLGNDTYIVAVGKWDYSRQTSDVFAYTPTGWSGVDFTIGPGDGIWLEIVSTFAWTPELMTPEIL